MHILNVGKLQGPILIVAPHPDDDILATGGLIQIAKRLGRTVYVLYITTGDGFPRDVLQFLHRRLTPDAFQTLGRVRHAEAVRAERFLGVPSSRLFFLGFPDGIMIRIATDRKLSRIHPSPFTHFSRAAYSFSYHHNAPYTHGSAVSLIESVLHKTRPRTVLLPLGLDIHPDHIAARILMLEALRHLGLFPQIYAYLVHYPNWPPPTGPLRPPHGVHIPGAVSLPLTATETKKTRIAYSMHRSQFSLRPNGTNIIRSNELFWGMSTHRKPTRHRRIILYIKGSAIDFAAHCDCGGSPSCHAPG